MINPEQIRRRLNEVWTALGDEVMRACALTLITATDDPTPVLPTLAELMPDHPSRNILLHLDNSHLLEADVEAQCWMPFGQRRQICCEQIVIRCSPETLSEVPAVILPLMVPDLPVVLWCASRRVFCSPAFPALAGLAGRVLADSYYIPESFSAPGVADLSWTRLTPWRAHLAKIFANRPDRGAVSRSLTIQHSGSRPPAALLFAGWVASRVSLEHLAFRSTGAPPAGDLVSFEFGEPAACVALPPRSDLLLLGEELSIQAPDQIYQQSRAEALRLAEIHS